MSGKSGPKSSGGSSFSDPNLLYGVMALRVGLITSTQLVAAMHSWVDAKTRHLGDVLVELGFLIDEEKTQVSAVVLQFLKRHGNDAKEGLNAIEIPCDLGKELDAINDDDLEDSLALARKSENAIEISDTTAFLKPPTNRFEILRFHAKGGLGKVSVARDKEIQREVAFKEIRDRYADDDRARTRFVFEAHVTGRLEHPGIVPIIWARASCKWAPLLRNAVHQGREPEIGDRGVPFAALR